MSGHFSKPRKIKNQFETQYSKNIPPINTRNSVIRKTYQNISTLTTVSKIYLLLLNYSFKKIHPKARWRSFFCRRFSVYKIQVQLGTGSSHTALENISYFLSYKRKSFQTLNLYHTVNSLMKGIIPCSKKNIFFMQDTKIICKKFNGKLIYIDLC